nr:X protein [Hepatitis B virus]
MAARLCCQLDPARDVLCLRPVGAESCGRPFSGSLGTLSSRSPSAVPTDHGAHLSQHGPAVSEFSSAGPCALRFTSARRMEAAVNAHQILPKVLHKRTLGLSAMSTTADGTSTKDVPFKRRIQLSTAYQPYVFVLRGCGHKLVCAPAPCNFFTSA